jgi:hypothetical protein
MVLKKWVLRSINDPERIVCQTAKCVQGFVHWCSVPPCGICYAVHKLTFLDALETAFLLLGTNYRDEWVLLSSECAAFVRTLPSFTEREPILGPRSIFICTIGRKRVYVGSRAISVHSWYVGQASSASFVRGTMGSNTYP